ncbi:MAG: hypothetical protein IJ412_10195 [Oscillospiraceae bacterium]|nr:hypothetical protein [Oscillospiraceae bacterium]
MNDEIWFHGTPLALEVLAEGSTVTRWRELAEAFSHKPAVLCIEDDGSILHNGCRPGHLYSIAEVVEVGRDLYQHPRTTMDEGLEFLTARPLQLEYLCDVPAPDKSALTEAQQRIEQLLAQHR